MITLELTRAQARALEWIADFGVSERRYVLDERICEDYTDEEIAQQEADLVSANEAICALQKALHGK